MVKVLRVIVLRVQRIVEVTGFREIVKFVAPGYRMVKRKGIVASR